MREHHDCGWREAEHRLATPEAEVAYLKAAAIVGPLVAIVASMFLSGEGR